MKNKKFFKTMAVILTLTVFCGIFLGTTCFDNRVLATGDPTYTVTFDKNGGDTEAQPSTMNVSINQVVGSLPTPPTRDGYTFVGWNTQDDGDGSVFTATTPVTQNLPVYAQWTLPGPDTTRPYILSSTPANAAIGVTKDTPISIVFSEDIRLHSGSGVECPSGELPQIGNGSKFKCGTTDGGNEANIILIVKYAELKLLGSPNILGSYNADQNTIEINPQYLNALQSDTTYYLTIPANAVYDLAGNGNAETVLTFTTAAPVGNWTDNAVAVDGTDYSIDGDIYTIKTATGLAWVAKQVELELELFTGKTVELDNDIDIGDHFWNPIGSKFAGTLDGKNHKITGLYIGSKASPTTGQQGLLSTIGQDAVVKNLGIESSKIMGGNDTTAGILAGTNSGTILSCYSKGEVTGGNNTTRVGGLAGENEGKIANSYSTADVSGGTLEPGPAPLAGGLVGFNNGGTIANCYASGNVSIGDGVMPGGNTYAGGLIGASSGGIVLNSYAAGNVTRGGFLANIGGFAGMLQVGSGIVENCYWQSGTAPQGNHGPGSTTEKTADELKSQDFLDTLNSNINNIDPIDGITFAIWRTNDGGYPTLIPPPKGQGTFQSPYIIHRTDDLQWMSCTYAAHNAFQGQYFIQDADIDMSSVQSFTPIGDQSWPFSGNYNGDAYTISNMNIDFGDKSQAGLFGYVGPGGIVKNLTLMDISFNTTCNEPNIGGIAGFNQGTIEDCHIKASANNESLISGSGDEVFAGGITGTNMGTISKCSNAATIQVGGSNHTDGCYYAGGITGVSLIVITNCFNTGNINNTDKIPDNIALGGIAGCTMLPDNTISFTYNVGTINLDSDVNKGHIKGGILGLGPDDNCVANSFYLQTPGLNAFNYVNDSDQIVSSSTGQESDDTLKTAATFNGWDTNLWILADGNLPRLTSILKTVSYSGNGSTGGTVPTDNRTYRQGATVTVLGNTGNLTKSGSTFAGWNSEADGTGTDYAADATFAIGDADLILYAKWTVSPGNSGSGSSGSSPNNNIPVTVGGQTQQQAATIATSTNNGRTTATVELDTQKMTGIINASQSGSTISVPVDNATQVVINRLDGELVKIMENQQSVVEIRTNTAIYPVPAQQINIDEASKSLGQDVSLSDITVDIQISNSSNEMVTVVENSAEEGNFSIVVPPIDFSITATYKDRTIDISKFNSYVERFVAIPDSADPSRITTAIVTEPNGEERHVPTQVIIIDGKYYAKINSITNSTYTIIWNPLEFTDVTKHWAKDAINDMGSRMVLSGISSGIFDPDRDITRCEFAAIIVRALGLEPGIGANLFTDISDSAWYCDYVATAADYKIISGYGNEKFGPLDKITREQAMAMISRAMNITELKAELTAGEADELLAGFIDADQSADYARNSIAVCLKSGIISGRSNNLIAPQENITRAEVAVIIQRFLKSSNFI